MAAPLPPGYRSISQLSLADLEAIGLLLSGTSIIDWHRLNFGSEDEAHGFMRAQELDLDAGTDSERAEAVKQSAISYLRRNFDFPIPKPVAQADLASLLLLASSRGHRQLCACTILKVMHIIHHLEARELLFMLPTSDQEVFHLVEQKVYRVIGGMLARGFPILEFIGGRKNKDSLYTKLLSKRETVAAQIYDKLRFRIVTRSVEDVLPTLNYLMQHVFPFNYIIPGESTNTLIPFRSYCDRDPHLSKLRPSMQGAPEVEQSGKIDNRFTASTYRVVHFVVDMPVRVPDEMLELAPPAARHLGRLIFVQTEFQVIDRENEQANELGDASHAAYKDRQRLAVMRRLKVGLTSVEPAPEPVSAPPPPPKQLPVKAPPAPARLPRTPAALAPPGRAPNDRARQLERAPATTTSRQRKRPPPRKRGG